MQHEVKNKNSFLGMLNLQHKVKMGDIIKCYSCGEGNHILSECPKTHLVLNKMTVLGKYNHNGIQERSNIKKRKIKIKANSLGNLYET